MRLRFSQSATCAAMTLIAAGTLISAASANVFGRDDRRPLSEADGITAVGVIACAGTDRIPTATLIEAMPGAADRNHDLIVTVAHALYEDGRRIDADCSFWPMADEAEAIPITDVWQGTRTPRRAWRKDWAVARLSRRAPDRFQPLPVMDIDEHTIRSMNRDIRFKLVGHNGTHAKLLISENCGPRLKQPHHFNYFIDNEFNHDCDMIPGWSGGPLIAIVEDYMAVIAVNSTEIHSVMSPEGTPFDPRFNPNTAIRITGRFETTLYAAAGLDTNRPPRGPLPIERARPVALAACAQPSEPYVPTPLRLAPEARRAAATSSAPPASIKHASGSGHPTAC